MSLRRQYVAGLFVLLLAALSGCSSSGHQAQSASVSPGQTPFPGAEFHDPKFGVSFHYPVAFRPAKLIKPLPKKLGAPIANAVLLLDRPDVLILQRYQLKINIPRHPLDPALLAQVDRRVASFAKQPTPGASVLVAGLPGARYDDVQFVNPPNVRARLVFFFDGRTEYELNCRSTLAHRAQVNSACDEVIASMTKS